MSQKYDCPSCGGAVIFQSSVAVFAVCPYCRSMVVRHDLNVEKIGEMAALPLDLSPLQIGTTGTFEGRAFTLIGRVRLAYDEGSWTEWYALFGDTNTYGWLGETQGFFTVGFAVEMPKDFPTSPDGLPVAGEVTIENQSFAVTDRKATTTLWGEGELPFIAKPKREACSIDLTSADGQFASVEFSWKEARLFVGRYARFDELNFSNLRPVPGWSEEVMEPIHQQTSALSCPKCGSTVELRAAGFTMSATCGSCGSLIDTSTPDLCLIRTAEGKKRITPRIPLGRRGELFGVTYEMIGFQHVSDDLSGWVEYLLFNPWQGFVWLVSYQGHWSFVNRLVERPEANGAATFKGETYRKFDSCKVNTDYVLGEFYWKVSVGLRVCVADFVRPPRILSRETYRDEETWSLGEYIRPEVIHDAFKLEGPLPEPVGIYLNQPNPHLEKGQQLKWLAPLLALVLLLIQIISASRAAGQKVLNGSYTFQAGTNALTVTEPFEIKGSPQAINCIFSTPVDNNWMEFDVGLVNSNTQQAAAHFVQEVGYYHGSDSDGPWSEGARKNEVLVPAVPPGKYYLTVDVAADKTIKEMPYSVTVIRDVTVWSNFWIAFVLLLAYPIYRWTRAAAFEKARWEESDLSE